MTITSNDIIIVKLTDEEISNTIQIANNITPYINDRPDLHQRDYLERFTDVLLGEIAEQMVLKWFVSNNKFAKSAVDKTSDRPDSGHDIYLKMKNDNIIHCSVKSSLSVLKCTIDEILDTFTIATKKSEIREVNVQVYFWLDIFAKSEGKYRLNVPSTTYCAIIGWIGKKEIDIFSKYKTENREAPEKKLREMHPMLEVLNYIV
jgi:hypothetical protein